MFILIAVVVAVDQLAKWWAWRHIPWAKINSGGDILVGHTIGAWYAAPATGALLDVLDFGLLSFAVWVLARYRVPTLVTVFGSLMIGGWGSNLLDRLGTHYWTAPGSVRGAVDFIYLGGRVYNIADFFIIGCTPLFILAAGWYAMLALRRPGAALGRPQVRTWQGAESGGRRVRLRSRMRAAAVTGAGLILVVVLGAIHNGGVSAAVRAPAGKTGQQAGAPP